MLARDVRNPIDRPALVSQDFHRTCNILVILVRAVVLRTTGANCNIQPTKLTRGEVSTYVYICKADTLGREMSRGNVLCVPQANLGGKNDALTRTTRMATALPSIAMMVFEFHVPAKQVIVVTREHGLCACIVLLARTSSRSSGKCHRKLSHHARAWHKACIVLPAWTLTLQLY